MSISNSALSLEKKTHQVENGNVTKTKKTTEYI